MFMHELRLGMKYEELQQRFDIKNNYTSSYREAMAEAIVKIHKQCLCCCGDSVYYMGMERKESAAKILPPRLDFGLCSVCSEIHTVYKGCYDPIEVELLDVFDPQLGPLHWSVDGFSCGTRVVFSDNDPGVMVVHQGFPGREVTIAHLGKGSRIKVHFKY